MYCGANKGKYPNRVSSLRRGLCQVLLDPSFTKINEHGVDDSLVLE